MKFIVLEPVKVAGSIRKPGDILGEDLDLDEVLIESLLAGDLIAVYEDAPDGDPDASTAPGARQARRKAKPA